MVLSGGDRFGDRVRRRRKEGPPIAFYEPNAVGSAMIADALAAVGFDPVTPPGG
jgi:hypothetical protein